METPETAERWITIDVAAEVIGRDRKWIDRQVARHRLRTRKGTNARNMQIALVERAEVVRLHEQARGHISDNAVLGDSGDSARDSSDGDSYVDMGSGSSTTISLNGRDRHDIISDADRAVSALTRLVWMQQRVNGALTGALWAKDQEIERAQTARLEAERRAAVAEQRAGPPRAKHWWQVWR